MMPHLHEFLYALSAGDGADPTRYGDQHPGATPPAPTNNNPIPTRNGEPTGELGMVLQQDFAWGDQTGAPADPQAGNVHGGKRDVLRSADFAPGTVTPFTVAAGTWKTSNAVYEATPASKGGDTVSVLDLADAQLLPELEEEADEAEGHEDDSDGSEGMPEAQPAGSTGTRPAPAHLRRRARARGRGWAAGCTGRRTC